MSKRRVSLGFRTGIVLFIVLLSLSAAAQQRSPNMLVDAGDDPLVMRGLLEEGVTSIEGVVRLTLQSEATAQLQLLASDLRHTLDENIIIGRENVTISEGLLLSPNRPQDVRVTVSNVAHSGRYQGQLRFVALEPETDDLTEEEQPFAVELEIALELNVEPLPLVKPLEETLIVNVMQCGAGLDCFLAGLLAPQLTSDKYLIPLENRSYDQHTVTSMMFSLRDERGRMLSSDAVVLDRSMATLAVREIGAIALMFNKIPIGRYNGNIYARIEGEFEPLTLPTSLIVRGGPLGVVLAIIAGIYIGPFVRAFYSDTARKQREVYGTILRFRESVGTLADPQTRQALGERLDKLLNDINSEFDAAVVDADVAAIRAALVNIKPIDPLYVQLESANPGLQARYAEIRQAVLSGNEFKPSLEALQEQLKNAQATRFREMGGAARSIDLDSAVTTADLASRAKALPAAPRRPTWWERVLSIITGFRVSAGIQYGILAPVMGFAIVLALAFLGFQTFYLSVDAIVGVNGIYDYVAPFVWGATSNVIVAGWLATLTRQS